jgi:general secretion pathway protein D
VQGGPVSSGPTSATGDRLVTRVILLRNESATQLVTVLRPLISPNNTIAAYPASNALVITDYADNLRRIERIVASLDQPSGGEPMVIPIKYASALDLVALVNRLVADAPAAAGQPAEPSQRVAMFADPRSNSILLRAESPGRAARIRALIEQLDTPQRAGGNVFIVYLKNADATRVAETLRGLYSGSGANDRGASPSALQPGAAAPTNVAGTSLATLGTSPQATSPLAAGSTGTTTPFSAAGATVQADVANNALLIMAPEPVYNNLRAVIERLDTRRAEVFVEALIAEVTSDKAAEFGIQWQVLTGLQPGRSGVQGVGNQNFGARGGGNNIIDASIDLTSVNNGLNLGLINGTVSIGGRLISNLGLLVRALESDANANILSTPTLLTMDNEEARIIVGQNVPFITGQYATTGQTSTVQPFQTIERRDVGLVLRVRPQITEGGTVRMTIYQEVSRVQDNTNPAGPILSKRALESSVVIDDQQIIVLGGLIQDSFGDTTQKVPQLGNVPIIGSLFRYDNRTRSKTNLLVFLKPTVVRTAPDGRAITSDRYEYLREEQNRQSPPFRWFWDDPTVPALASPPSPVGTSIVPATPSGTYPPAPVIPPPGTSPPPTPREPSVPPAPIGAPSPLPNPSLAPGAPASR